MATINTFRRTLMTGMVAALGTALFAPVASAFPRGTQGLLKTASRTLRRFGFSFSADIDDGRDMLRVTIQPRNDTVYEQITRVNGVDACWGELSLGSDVEFTNFDASTNEPNMKLIRKSDQFQFDIRDNGVNLTVRTAAGRVYRHVGGELVPDTLV